MNNKTLFKTHDFISSLEGSGVEVKVDSSPDPTAISRIKNLIKKKEMLFNFQKSLFN